MFRSKRSSYRDPFSFPDEKASRGTSKAVKYAMLCLCMILLFVVYWLLSPYMTSAPNVQADLTSLEISSLHKTLNRQQNQILSLQELVEAHRKLFDQLTPRVDQLDQITADTKEAITKWEHQLLQIETTIDQLQRSFHSQLDANQMMATQNADDIQEIESKILLITELQSRFHDLESTVAAIQEIDNRVPEIPVEASADHEVIDHKLYRNQDHIYVILIDFGSFLDMYERRRTKIVPCGSAEVIGIASVEKIYTTVDSLYQMEEKSSHESITFSILLSTTETRRHYFDDLSNVQVITSPQGAGYGDLCNIAVGHIDDNDATLVFIYPGSIIRSNDFLQSIVAPLRMDNYSDAGIVTSKVIQKNSDILSSCGVEVGKHQGVPSLHFRWQDYWKNDRRAQKSSYVPSATPYSAWSIPIALFQSVGGMMSDEYVEYTPSYHLYDLCLTIAEEAAHYDKDITDDDDIEGICQLQERHQVLYHSSVSVEIEISECEQKLLDITPHSFEWIEFTERWSSFLEEEFIIKQRVSNVSVVWESNGDSMSCRDTSAVLGPVENMINAQIVLPKDVTCNENEIGSETMARMRNTDVIDSTEIWITPFTPGNFSEVLTVNNKAIRSPSVFIGRQIEPVSIEDSQRERIDQFYQIWVPFQNLADDLMNQRVNEEKIVVVPSPVDFYFYDREAVQESQEKRDSFVFLTITDLSDASWKNITQAFYQEFVEDDVVLYFYVSLPISQQERNAKVALFNEEIDLVQGNNVNRVELLSETINEYDLARLLKFVDATVLFSFQSPIMQYWNVQKAIAMEVPTIATQAGPHSDFMNVDYSYLMNDTSIQEIQQSMRTVFEQFADYKEKATLARDALITHTNQHSIMEVNIL